MTLHSTSSPAPAQPAAVPPRHETLSEQDFQDSEQAAAKAFRRILPFIFICYVVSYLDRTNVSFAALGMNADLGITAEQFGFGAGMFFIGYFLFEIPSNLIMQKVGARIWIARIMISWGLISMATAFISGPVSFAIARFCLGVAEADFTPGIYLFYLLVPWQLARQNHRRVPSRHSGGQYHRLTDFRRADADHRP
ncbi:hypothetical protein E05_05260 [Plautia stali symbiont]|nr:hypothetical protein E05_05260 [Plautia stali symbiont]